MCGPLSLYFSLTQIDGQIVVREASLVVDDVFVEDEAALEEVKEASFDSIEWGKALNCDRWRRASRLCDGRSHLNDARTRSPPLS